MCAGGSTSRSRGPRCRVIGWTGPLRKGRAKTMTRPPRRFVWIGGEPVVERSRRSRCRLMLPNPVEDAEVRLSPDKAEWLLTLIRTATPARAKHGQRYPLLRDVRARFPFGGSRVFDALLRSAAWQKARTVDLLLV